MTRAIALTLPVALAACAPDVPAEPTWAADIKPILDASCVRCHGAPAIGAPPAFRLDRYDDTVAAGGEVLQGAGAMAEYLWRKVDGDDPPHGGLDPWQVDTLRAWWELAPGPTERPPRGAPAPANRPPSLRVAVAGAPASALLLDYELTDPDLETVHGELRVGPTFAATQTVATDLHAGRGTTGFSTALLPGDDVHVYAVVDDGSIQVIEDLGVFDANHDGDRPPRIRVAAPAPLEILPPGPPAEIVFQVLDADSPGPFTADVRALPDPADPDAEPVVIATDVLVEVGAAVVVPWDTAVVEERATWRVAIEVSDGAGSSGGATVDRLIVSHATTDETFTSMLDVFGVCGACHFDPGSFPGNAWDFTRWDDGALLGVRTMRDEIYRRAVVQQTMPPRGSGLTLSAEQRARLAEWLLAGAPLEAQPQEVRR